jgi:uncharacterized membrane protein
MKNLIKNILSKDDLTAISQAVGEVEKYTSGEVRVSIRQRRRWSEKKLSLEEIARQEFSMLGMANTKDRTGVLIFLLLEDRRFYILADETINTKVESGTWNRIADDMSQLFSKKSFREGIICGVRSVGKVLSANFPIQKDDKNELPNNVHIN